MTLALRPYQTEAKQAIYDAHERGVEKQLVALPTGTGKTVIFSDLIRERGGTALILAHRDELLGQAEGKLAMVGPELAMSIGRVQADRNDVGSTIIVASVQTLARENRLLQLPKEFGTVIVDEAHHATADSYRRILDHVESPVVVGFTATPERADKGRLEEVFDEIVYARSLLQMIEDGYLCDLQGIRVDLEDLDLSSVKVSAGDYQAKALGEALEDAHAPEHLAASLLEHAPKRKTICFLPTVQTSKLAAAAIVAAGLNAEHLDGETPKDQRREILRRFSEGETQVITNVDVLTEGYDEPSVDCIAIAAPTRSRIAYVQRVGRGTRLYPGKEDCLVLDLAGVTEDLNLQSLPDLFGLEAPPKPGETATEAVIREAAEKAAEDMDRKQQKADERKRKAAAVGLFNRDRLHWLHFDRRWVLNAGEGDLLVLDPIDENNWRVMLVKQDRARILARNLDLGYAQGAAEEAVRRRGAVALADKEAAWRKRSPKDGQIAYMGKLGITERPGTRGECSDLINAALARERLQKLDAALARREAESAA